MDRLSPFPIEETHGILRRPENRVNARSDGLGWTQIYASMQQEVAYEGHFPAVRDQLIVMHLDGPVKVDSHYGSTRAQSVVPAGGLHLVPSGVDFGVRLMGSLSTLHVYVRRDLIEQVAAEVSGGDPMQVEIPPKFLEPDPALNTLMDAVRVALEERASGSAMYVDFLARALACRLVLYHSNRKPQPVAAGKSTGAITPAVEEAIEFMRSHIEMPLTLDDIARGVNRTVSQIARQFRVSLGVPPHQYLLDMRVKLAQHMLRTTVEPIAEIAFACGFSHQEHLTRMFRRCCNTTPAVYRKAARH